MYLDYLFSLTLYLTMAFYIALLQLQASQWKYSILQLRYIAKINYFYPNQHHLLHHLLHNITVNIYIIIHYKIFDTAINACIYLRHSLYIHWD